MQFVHNQSCCFSVADRNVRYSVSDDKNECGVFRSVCADGVSARERRIYSFL